MFDAYLAQHRDRFLGELLDLVRIPSISQTGEGIDDAVAFLKTRFEKLGCDTRVYPTSGHPVIIAETGPPGAKFTLLIYGHYDVVAAAKSQGWNTEPFEPVIDGDRIWGRGAGDNKGQHLARVFGLEVYREVVGKLPIRVKFVIEGEEETGSRGFTRFVKENPELLKADLCCYSDAPMFPHDQPVLFMGVRGMLQLEFRATGAVKGLHSGLFGGVAPSPIMQLCRLFAKLVDADGNIVIPEFVQRDQDALDRDLAALKKLPFDYAGVVEQMGVAPVTGDDGVAYYRNLMCRHSFNISGISGGYTGAGARNAIPNEAIAKVDIRVAGGFDADELFAALETWVKNDSSGSITVMKLSAEPPSKTPVDGPYVEVIKRAVAKGFGREPLVVPSMGATTPDYVFTEVLGMPSILVPFAPYDENNHVANESTKVSLYLSGIKASAHIIDELARAYG
jgi:acetylornithine deacetylase/succinyl-diaminopimelate desuccinylase-like protein